MHQYDTALKNVLQRLSAAMLEHVTGYAVARWINVEFPEVRSPRVDLLGETADGRLVHIELQSTNEAEMALRMAEYSLAICRRFGQMPAQVVLYVGFEPLKMTLRLEGRHLSFECPVIDVRDLDRELWLASDHVDDNVVAILLRFGDELDSIRRVLARIAASEPGKRAGALAELLVLAGLRKVGDIIRREAERMPILNDIMDHEVFGPLIRQSTELGWSEGRNEGRIEGRIEGETQLVLRQLAQRFGPVPDWARNRIQAMSLEEIDHIGLRLLDADSLESLLR